MKQDFATIIREAIERDGRSLYQLARDCGLRYSVLHRFATGERQKINIDTATAICGELGLELRRVKRKGGQ